VGRGGHRRKEKDVCVVAVVAIVTTIDRVEVGVEFGGGAWFESNHTKPVSPHDD
jgi:hypothetical protein